MNKKVLVEKIGCHSRPIVQPQQNYTLVTQGDGQNPLILTCSLLKPPPRHEANILLNVDPANSLILSRSASTVSNYPAPSNVPTCIVLTPHQPQAAVQNHKACCRTTPLINSPKPAATKGLNSGCKTSKKKSPKDADRMTNGDKVQKPPGPASTSTKRLTVSDRETNAKPMKTPRSIKISLKNLVALDEDTKKSISATSSVANFLEKDTSEKGLEVLDSLDDTSLTLLVTKVMETLNKMYGDYLEEELTAHLGAEKYRRIASRGLTTFSQFLARRHAMVRKESPVKAPDRAHFNKSKKFVKFDPKRLLMEEMSNGNAKEPKTSPEAHSGSQFAEADKCISEKINFWRERDVSKVKSSAAESLDLSVSAQNTSKRSVQENSGETPLNLLQVDGMNKNRSNYPQNETERCKNNDEIAKKTVATPKNSRKPKNPRKHQKEDLFKFDPLLSRPSESIRENKSVVLSSPENLNCNTEGVRKLESSSSPTSPDKNSDFPNFNFKPLVSRSAESESLSNRISKAFKWGDAGLMRKTLFEESPIKNGFPGFCASKDLSSSHITYLLGRLDSGLKKVAKVKAAENNLMETDEAPATEPVQTDEVGNNFTGVDRGQIEVDRKRVETSDIVNEYNRKERNLEELDNIKLIKKEDNNNTDQQNQNVCDVKNSVKTETFVVTITPDMQIKQGSPSSSSDDISKACDSPDLQKTVKDLTQLLKTFTNVTEPFDSKPPFESGISNDSFESFAQKAKSSVNIKEDHFNDVDGDVDTTGSNLNARIDVKSDVQSDIRLDGAGGCETEHLRSCEKFETPKILSDDDSDCVLIETQANQPTNIPVTCLDASRRNTKKHRQQLKNCLQKKVSSLSRTIQKRIGKVTATVKCFGRMIEAIKDGIGTATVDVLRQKTRNLYAISNVVNKTFVSLTKKDVVRLKSTLAKSLVAREGRSVLASRAVVGKRTGGVKSFQKRQDMADSTFSKSKSDSAISSASTEGAYVRSASPEEDDIREPTLRRGVPEYVSDNLTGPECQIVQCYFYTNDKRARDLGFDARVKPAQLKQPDLGKKGQVNRPKDSRGRAENNKKSGANPLKKGVNVMQEGPFNSDSAKGGRKRKRSASTKPVKKQQKTTKKSYALRKRKDASAPVERSYPLRSRQGGTCA